MAAAAPRKPSGLSISTKAPLMDAFLPYEPAQGQQAAEPWFGCSVDSPPSHNSTGTLRVHAGRPCVLPPQLGQGAIGSPTAQQGSSSTACSSPKSPHHAAAAQLRGLQRTPLPLILARMKVLLERLHMCLEEQQGTCGSAAQTPTAATAAAGPRPRSASVTAATAPATSHATAAAASLSVAAGKPGSRAPAPATAPQAPGRPASGSSTSSSSKDAAGRTAHVRSSSGGAQQPAGRSKARGCMEVSTSGGLCQSIMQQSAQSVLQELDVTLGFISEFLGSLHSDTRKALAAVARLEVYKKDQLIYDMGDDPTHFYVILSGRVDIWSHPVGAHRPKSIVRVLRRGDAFGDQAIINGQPHGSAASPATNVTLLAVTRQDFLAVLGAHFRDVAAALQQFLVGHVAPMAECDPGMVRRLCSTLVTGRPCAGQECSVHEDQVCFIQAGSFELRLVDLQAHAAAQAALAAAVASASSALPIAPIPAHLQLGPGGRPHSSSGSGGIRRPASAPPGGRQQQHAAAPGAAAAAGAAAGLTASKGAQGSGPGGSNGSAAGSSVLAAAAAGGAAAAAGLELLLQGEALADCPALGTEGVLASVRVKDGRLVGTQGLVKQLRKQHGTRVPYKVLAELGPGGWFGGGEAIYGSGPLQSALRVVAVGPDCAVVHAHLSSLEKHGGPALIKRLRDDAAFKLTYYLGRIGVLPPLGAAVGHPESALVADTAAAAAAAEAQQQQQALLSFRAPGSCCTAAAGAPDSACTGSVAASVIASPGRGGPCSTSRSRPASAAAATAAASAGRHRRVTGGAASRSSSPPPPATARAAPGMQSPSRPASASKGAAAASRGVRRTSSIGSAVSSAWDDAAIGVMPPPASAADAAGGVGTIVQADSAVGAAPAAAAAATTAAAPGGPRRASVSAGDSGSVVSGGFGSLKASRARQKRVHVPGSGVFGAGVMAALQHVHALQAQAGAGRPVHEPVQSSSNSTGRSSGRQVRTVGSKDPVSGALEQTSLAAAAEDTGASSSSSSTTTAGGELAAASLGEAARTGVRASVCVQGAAAAPRGSILDAAAVKPCGRPLSGGSCRAVGLVPARACAGTAAEVYFQQPENSSTATGTALSGLLSSLFTDGLQPLVTELDCLLSHTQPGGPLLQQHMQAGTLHRAAELQQQRWDVQHSQQPARPASAAARLQRPVDGHGGLGSSGVGPLEQQAGRPDSAKAVHWGRHVTAQQQHCPRQSQAGRLQQPVLEAQARPHLSAQQQSCEEAEVLRHKPAASLLAASVMWQRSSEAAFRPPLRQCLTTAEIAQQRSRGVFEAEEGCSG